MKIVINFIFHLDFKLNWLLIIHFIRQFFNSNTYRQKT